MRLPMWRKSQVWDRFAETTQKMREDYTGVPAKPLGKRCAMAHIGEAVNLAQVLEKHGGKASLSCF